MGLPLFVVPAEPEVDSKSTEKLAAIPRSAIRRATIRPRRSDVEAQRRRSVLGLIEGSRELYAVNDSESRPPRPAAIPEFHERLVERETLLEFERQRRTPDSTGRMMPPVPESGDFASITPNNPYGRPVRARQEGRRFTRSGLRSQPFSLTDAERESMNMPHHLPHHLPHHIDPTPQSTNQYSPALFRPPPTILQGRVDLLNARSNRLLRDASLDGLGDRNRSISPPGEGWYREISPEMRRDANHEIGMSLTEDTTDAWDTLLTSITPDPQPPSAGSSFASSSAAAETSASTTGPSSGATSMTSAGGTQDPLPCDITDGSESEEEDMYELPNFANNRGSGDRFWRTYATVVTAGPNRDPRPGVDAEHLDGMHRIISRLASRDEIPENWWASAGLSRILRRDPAA